MLFTPRKSIRPAPKGPMTFARARPTRCQRTLPPAAPADSLAAAQSSHDRVDVEMGAITRETPGPAKGGRLAFVSGAPAARQIFTQPIPSQGVSSPQGSLLPDPPTRAAGPLIESGGTPGALDALYGPGLRPSASVSASVMRHRHRNAMQRCKCRVVHSTLRPAR